MVITRWEPADIFCRSIGLYCTYHYASKIHDILFMCSVGLDASCIHNREKYHVHDHLTYSANETGSGFGLFDLTELTVHLSKLPVYV
jgi:hypothetical protein